MGLATLGLAKLRKWLSSVGAYFFLCSANPWTGKARLGSRAGTYQVAYQTVGYLISKKLQEGSENDFV